ncbi:glycosyltransferase [Asticcacaulis machinosus]|uniref:Glycosyltransferase n=1 Tax=Asticcacaulis machinosus TaxID=2984211 RepID=A0ABT5HLE7_9CAUL|nr:glycosyltransferase [Asticcacaulis machinosus]MDC7676434.1 glycosyltransferase [Asticcacaulis machinosus]
MNRQIKVLAPTGYPWAFNGPRRSRHKIRNRRFVPFNRLSSTLDGVTVFNPVDEINCDMLHAFNRVPVTTKPFVIGFESHLPRIFGIENKPAYHHFLYSRLLSSKCRQIIAISNYALRNFERDLAASHLSASEKEILRAKTQVRYPNMIIPDPHTGADEENDLAHNYQISFVGNHFARKGGCTMARMAELSLQRKLPFTFTIVSSLQYGGHIWSDPTNPDFYAPYLKLLNLPNVRHIPTLANDGVMKLLGESYASALPTFSDTFGYSAIESLALGTPVIASAQGALPEFIEDGVNGIMLDPAVTEGDPDWRPHWFARGTVKFEALFAANVERFAVEAVNRLEQLLEYPEQYRHMRRQAKAGSQARFGHEPASTYWDDLYLKSV